ncbi:MAG: acyl-CoA synthetase (AMP-forming)/AMP-acid ligase II/acyl carrier protein, partial [Candidatus Marinamargulisbacteria bacterium]
MITSVLNPTVINDHKKISFHASQDEWETLVTLLQWRAEHQPNRVAFTFLADGESDAHQITYHGLHEKAKAIASLLIERKLSGQRILMLYPSGIAFIEAFFGCLYAGAYAVPAYPPKANKSVKRLQSIINDADAALILTTDKIKSITSPKMRHIPELTRLEWVATDAISSAGSENWACPSIDGETIAFLQYTSGSTAAPKGVMVSHKNLIYNLGYMKSGMNLSAETRSVMWLPNFHDLGLILGILEPIYAGFTAVLMMPVSFVQKPIRWLRAISHYKATHTAAPNFAFELCMTHTSEEERAGLDLSHLETMLNGAEPIRPSTISDFSKMFAPLGFKATVQYPAYGLAEATLVVTGSEAMGVPIVENIGGKQWVGCGHVWDETRVAIVNPVSKKVCETFVEGEVWVSGPTVAKGYWQNAEATKETFDAFTDDRRGPFLRTGDLGLLNASGELFICGRIKDMMILNGQNIYPQDIEYTVESSHPGVRAHNAAAFTIASEDSERLVVVAELERSEIRKENKVAIFEAIEKSVSEGHDQQVSAIVLVKTMSIPKTTSGKIQRQPCKAAYLAGTLDVIASWTSNRILNGEKKRVPPETDSEVLLLSIWESVIEEKQICMLDDFFSVGGNSITATQILSRVEEGFGVEIEIEDLFQQTSIRALAAFIDQRQIDLLQSVEADC